MVDGPRDPVAIFHCSFHPTRGNVVDWSLKASEDIDLSNVEFSCLPSGLHTIEEDVVYFYQNGHPGLCIFRRRQTGEEGHRGFRLSSLGVLFVPPSSQVTSPRPWLHVSSLKSLVHTIYSSLEHRDVLEPKDEDWEPARTWFNEHRSLLSTDEPSFLTTSHLPHLLSASSLGPSLLTISRFLLARRRVLLLVKPPVEGAGMVCWTIGELCLRADNTYADTFDSARIPPAERPKVMGMVTLHDIDWLQQSAMGPGWIACTTDSVFADKTRCWDLLVDVTTCDFSSLASTPSVRPVADGRAKMYVPKGSLEGGSGPQLKIGKKESVRFAWSDVKLWTELIRLTPTMPTDTIGNHTHTHTHSPSSDYRPPPGPSPSIMPQSWADVGRIYEDACILCAGMWYSPSQDDGRIRLDGEDNISVASPPAYDRSKKMPVDNVRRRSSSGDSRANSARASRKPSNQPSGVSVSVVSTSTGKARFVEEPTEVAEDEGDDGDDEESSGTAAHAVSQAFTAYHVRFYQRLNALIEESNFGEGVGGRKVVVLAPKDLAWLNLGPLSAMDARWVEWLSEVYADAGTLYQGTHREAAGVTRVKVRRARWRDVLGAVFGFG